MRIKILTLTLAALPVLAQQSGPPPEAEASKKTLAASMDTYVFPQQEQSASQQSRDEDACYNWAIKNTGLDPFQLKKQSREVQEATAQAQQQASQAGHGTIAKTTLGTAAVGTLIGGISGNEGKGAMYGAAAGWLMGNRRKRNQQAQAGAQATAAGQQAQADVEMQMESFKKAFSVCLEGKSYLVKY